MVGVQISEKEALGIKMYKALQKLLGKEREGNNSDAALLKIELQEKEAELQRLRRESRLERERTAHLTEAGIEKALEEVMTNITGPLANLSAMQARYRQDGNIKVADLLSVAIKIEASLHDFGLEAFGAVGETTSFDPGLHHLLDADIPVEGEPVVVRFTGYRYKGRTIRKTMVRKVSEITKEQLPDGTGI